MTRILPAAFAAVALVACTGAAKAPAKQPPAKPALWKVTDPDTTVYLFGTIHLLPKGLNWTGPKLDAAMQASQTLVLETVIDDPAKLSATLARLDSSPNLPPILDRVRPEKRDALRAAIDRSGLSMTALDRMETWAATLGIASAALRKADLSHEAGAEQALTRSFRAAGKPVAGLETPEQQLGFFDALPEAAQRKFLEGVATSEADMQREFDAMIAAWRRGDVRQIAVTFDDEMRQSPELAATLLYQRNANWAAWIAERMKQPGTVFVAVGAGHLAGRGAVEQLVARKGFRVTRVQ
jgi:uncharacterized protein